MFRKNSRHLQIPLTSHVDELPEPLRKRLRNSWAETFYQQFFCRLDETPFEVLYADVPCAGIAGVPQSSQRLDG